MLTLDTADTMGSPRQFPEYRDLLDFPEYKEPLVQFPEYHDPIEIMADLDGSLPVNKLVEQVIRTPGRQPSPQPTHFSVPVGHKNGNGNGNGHRVLRSATVGYIAPEFKGKKAQMAQGT
jgi:glutamate dehydrogenase